MADRFQKLFSLENNLYIENAPIIISAAALLKDTKSGNIVVQVKFKSVSNKNIKGVKISLSAYDVSGKEINGVDDYQYLDLNIPNGQSFGSSKAIVMPEITTRSFDIKSITVIFADSSIWENASPDFVVIPNAKTLNCELENEELVKQYKIATTKKANYIPNTFLNLWTCCCEEVNSEEYCTNCGTNRNDAFSKYNITDLTDAMNLRLDKERTTAEKLKKKNKKIVTASLFIICVTIAFIIISTKIIIPNIEYKKANSLIADKKYDQAYEMFIKLENFKDSKKRLNDFKIIYKTIIMKSSAGDQYIDYYDNNNSLQKTIIIDGVGDKQTSEYIYDSNGRLLQKKFTNSNMEERYSEYTYDLNGNLSKEIHTDSNGVISYSTEYSYNSNGKCSKEIFYIDSDGEEIDSTTEYSYDSNGNLLKEIEMDYYNNMKYSTVYTYDFNCQCLQEITTSSDGISWSTEYIYDSDGNCLKEIYTNSDKKKNRIYEYAYDSNGNLLKEIEMDSNGVKIRSWEYTYKNRIVLYNADAK